MSSTDLELQAPAAAPRVGAVGYAPMDQIHAELDGLLLRAESARDDEVVALLEAVQAHLQEHFEIEDRWMEETSFPPRDCHIKEHAAVLATSGGVLQIARDGDLAPGRNFLVELGRWFPGHADYLDSALAAWMCKRQFGGKPVVVHRAGSLALHSETTSA